MRVLFILLLSATFTTLLGLKPDTHARGGLVAIAAAREHPDSGSQSTEESGSGSQEHAEHPAVEGAEHPEHPEHPGSETKAAAVVERPPVTIESVATYLEAYVASKAAETDGWYRIEDEKAGTTLRLKLDHIHRERLAKTAERTWFVCADFTTPEGRLYDLDFWVRDTYHGLAVSESMVHKEEGKPRYSWIENEGVWSRKPLD